VPTVSEILELAPGACFLAGNAVDKSVLFNRGRLNPILPNQIYAIYFVTKKIYDKDPSYNGLVPVCNYLWEIMGRYGVAAQQFTGGGGSVSPVTPSTKGIYPLAITSADFESDGVSYNNHDIIGDNIMLFINQYSQQWLLAGQGFFVYTDEGIRITLDGFDANTQEYTIIIEQVFGSGVTPTPSTENSLLINTTDSLLINSTDSLLIS